MSLHVCLKTFSILQASQVISFITWCSVFNANMMLMVGVRCILCIFIALHTPSRAPLSSLLPVKSLNVYLFLRRCSFKAFLCILHHNTLAIAIQKLRNDPHISSPHPIVSQ